LGASGLGLANAIAYSLEAAFLLIVLNRQLGPFLRLTPTFLRAVAGASMSALVVLIMIAGLSATRTVVQTASIPPIILFEKPATFITSFPFTFQAENFPVTITPGSIVLAVIMAAIGLASALPFVWKDISQFMKA
jgi:hypothetical protein